MNALRPVAWRKGLCPFPATKFLVGVTGDVMTPDSQASAGYWEIVQDALADLVRSMLCRCYDEEQYLQLYNHCRNLRGEVWLSDSRDGASRAADQ